MFSYIPILIIIIIIITTLTLLVIIIIIIIIIILGINVPSLAKKRFSEIEFALGIILSGTVMKYVNRSWHSRFFVIIAEPNINPNLNNNIIFDTTATTSNNNKNNCNNNVKNYHDEIVNKLNNSSKSKDNNSSNNNNSNNYQANNNNNSSITTDYYLLEYSTSVESKWGFIPIAYKWMYPIKHVVSIVIKAKKEFKIAFDGSHEEVGGVGTDRRDENIR